MPLPKLHWGRCPWPLFDKGLWQFSKLLRLVSLGTKSCQESELYLPLQQLVWKLCYKIRKKWSSFKSKWIIGAMAARCWRARENWGAAWQILLNHSFWEWKKALGVYFLRFTYLPIGLVWLKIASSCTNQKWNLGSQERFCSANTVFNKIDVMDSFLSCDF